jgi:hypothetical protein
VRVLAAGEQSMEMLGENGEVAVRVVDTGVMMIVRHDGAKGKPTWPTNAALLHKR